MFGSGKSGLLPAAPAGMVHLVTASRLLTLDDVPVLAEVLRADREFQAPWSPERPERYFTDEGQRAVAIDALRQYEAGAIVPHVILDEQGQIAGRITLNEIARGPFLSCRVGYWVASGSNGRGLASAALSNMKRVAFGELGLHRIEAGTLLHNARSQRVLLRNGFTRIGIAPNYLQIAGEWQDHLLFQVIRD
jgi:ribosomal-protein-alanine N-acetyltransferase